MSKLKKIQGYHSDIQVFVFILLVLVIVGDKNLQNK